MKAHEQILMSLPDEFSRADFITRVGELTAYSLQHAQNLLDASLHEGLIERVDRGRYEKVNTNEQIEV